MIKMYAIFCRETLSQMKFEGKLAAQAGHAYLHAWWDAEDRTNSEHEEAPGFLGYDYCDTMDDYRNGDDARKIALVVDTVQDLEHLYELYKPYMGATIVDDCGYTVFECTTTTAVGLGPVNDEWFREDGHPQLLKSLYTLRNEIHRNANSA
jgi:peptidyl-tRNA hydrolase